jgi:hypothetical protein
MRVLRDLPRDLSETYDRFLSRVDGAEQREFVKRMFNWIICARRPLQVNELREAIAFTINDQQFDAAKIPNDLNRLVRACGNLATIKMSPSLGSRGRPHFTDRIQKEWPQAVRLALHLRSTLHRFFYYIFPF